MRKDLKNVLEHAEDPGDGRFFFILAVGSFAAVTADVIAFKGIAEEVGHSFRPLDGDTCTDQRRIGRQGERVVISSIRCRKAGVGVECIGLKQRCENIVITVVCKGVACREQLIQAVRNHLAVRRHDDVVCNESSEDG